MNSMVTHTSMVELRRLITKDLVEIEFNAVTGMKRARSAVASIEPELPLPKSVTALALQLAHGLGQGLQIFLGVEEVYARPNVRVRLRDEADDELPCEKLLGRLLRCYV